jgi:hypothetical protein
MTRQSTLQLSTALNLQALSDDELIRLRAALDVEMRRRSLAVSVGQIGEELAISYFRSTSGLPKLQRAPNGTKNVDALSRDGDRYSIKSVCNAKKTGTIYPDSDDPDKALFEYLLIVRLSPEWTLLSIHQFSWSDFKHSRSWDRRMNAWYLPISSKSLSLGKLLFSSESTIAKQQ